MRSLHEIIRESVYVKIRSVTVEDAAADRPVENVEDLKEGTEFIVHISPDFPEAKADVSSMHASFRYRVRGDFTVEQLSFVPSFQNVKPLVDTGRWVTKLAGFGPQIAEAIARALKVHPT